MLYARHTCHATAVGTYQHRSISCYTRFTPGFRDLPTGRAGPISRCHAEARERGDARRGGGLIEPPGAAGTSLRPSQTSGAPGQPVDPYDPRRSTAGLTLGERGTRKRSGEMTARCHRQLGAKSRREAHSIHRGARMVRKWKPRSDRVPPKVHPRSCSRRATELEANGSTEINRDHVAQTGALEPQDLCGLELPRRAGSHAAVAGSYRTGLAHIALCSAPICSLENRFRLGTPVLGKRGCLCEHSVY